MSEKTYVAGWWLWILLLIVISVPVLFGLNSAGLFFGKKVERAVLVNSHQYIEGMNQRGAILTANIAEAEAMLSAAKDEETRANITTQLAALRAQRRAITQ